MQGLEFRQSERPTDPVQRSQEGLHKHVEIPLTAADVFIAAIAAAALIAGGHVAYQWIIETLLP